RSARDHLLSRSHPPAPRHRITIPRWIGYGSRTPGGSLPRGESSRAPHPTPSAERQGERAEESNDRRIRLGQRGQGSVVIRDGAVPEDRLDAMTRGIEVAAAADDPSIARGRIDLN